MSDVEVTAAEPVLTDTVDITFTVAQTEAHAPARIKALAAALSFGQMLGLDFVKVQVTSSDGDHGEASYPLGDDEEEELAAGYRAALAEAVEHLT